MGLELDIGRNKMPQGRGEYHRKVSRPVTIRGVTYASMGEASRALDVSHTCVSSAVKRGTLDFVGLRKANNNCKPVIVNGVWYPSVLRASVETGIGIKKIRKIAVFANS